MASFIIGIGFRVILENWSVKNKRKYYMRIIPLGTDFWGSETSDLSFGCLRNFGCFFWLRHWGKCCIDYYLCGEPGLAVQNWVRGHNVKWNRPDTKWDTTWFHLHAISRAVEFIVTERMGVARSWGREEWGVNVQQGQSFSFRRWESSGDGWWTWL